MRRAGGASAGHAWGTTLLRLVVGVVFVMHGYLALGKGAHAMSGYITAMGYPAGVALVLAWYLIVAHAVGGILIIIGLWTRWAALANIPPMASAVFLFHINQGFFMKSLNGQVGGYEFSLTVLVAAIALVLLGSGAASVDSMRR